MKMSADDVKTAAVKLGADLCGIASVDRFTEAPKGFHPQDVLPAGLAFVDVVIEAQDGHILVQQRCRPTGRHDTIGTK